MINKNLIALLLSILLFGQSFAQTVAVTEPNKMEVSAALQEKAAGLLNDLARESEQFALPKNRVVARVAVGSLLWERDEKQARGMFQSAIAELINLLSQIQPPEEEATEKESSDRYTLIFDLRNMRTNLVTALAPRDPALALELLRTLTNDYVDGADYKAENQALEMSLAAEIARKDPKQAYELAKKGLEEGLSYNFFTTLEDLYKKDADLGAKLARELSGKITSRDTKINSPYDTEANAANPPPTGQTSTFTIGTWDVQSFLTLLKKLHRQAGKDKTTPLLTEAEQKELVGILTQKYVAQPYISAYEVAPLMPEINKYFPAQAQLIRRKIGQENQGELNNMVRTQVFESEIEGRTAEEIQRVIVTKPAAERDELYWKAAEKAYNDGEVAKAREFYSKIKTKKEYDYLGDSINADLPFAMAEKGDPGQIREALGKVKTPEERIQILTVAAHSLAAGGDKRAAGALIEEARTLYTGKTKHRKNLESLLGLARAYAVYDAEQGFNLLESNMTFVNDLISAAVLLEEFNESGAVESEELLLERTLDESYRLVKNGVGLIIDLSAADFDRTANLADKFSRPEARFVVRLRIAQALLEPNALETEKAKQKQMTEAEHYDH